jgi:anaerobic sulfite reductase subunit B
MPLNIYTSTPTKIVDIIKHNALEWAFRLAYPAASAPGKFIIVSIAGEGEVPISVSGFYGETLEITVRKAGEVTSALFEKKVGDTIGVRGPYGNTFPIADFFGKHLLVIAGGSAVAAIKAIVNYYHTETTCSLRHLDIIVGFRSPKHILFKDDLKVWEDWATRCNVVMSVDTNEDPADAWKGKIGFVTNYIKDIRHLNKDSRAIVVGPPRMMENCVKELLAHGVQEENIWLSFERHMKCGVGKCGHCRISDKYVCNDGPIFNYRQAKEMID